MHNIQIKNNEFELYIPYNSIQKGISNMAEKLNIDYKNKNPIIIGVLNGSFMFMADLAKELNINCIISFIKVSSYNKTKSTGKVTNLIGLTENIKDKDVIIVEDIVDTGTTITNLKKNLLDKLPKSISVATLFFKPSKFLFDTPPEYYIFDIPNYFIVGYGLDYDKYGRNLKDVYKLKSKN